MVEDDPFPVDPVDQKPTGSRPAKGTPEAKAWGKRMAEKRAAKRAAGGSKPKPAAPVRTPGVAEIESDLAEGFTKLGAMMLVPMPVPGTYMLNTSGELAEGIARLAQRNPKILEALQSTSNIMDYVAVGGWALGFLVAFGVQFGRVPANAPIAGALGITNIVEELETSGVLAVAHDEGEPVEGSSPAFRIPTPPEPDLIAEAVAEARG